MESARQEADASSPELAIAVTMAGLTVVVRESVAAWGRREQAAASSVPRPQIGAGPKDNVVFPGAAIGGGVR